MSSTDMLGLTDKVGIVWGGGYGMGERSSLRLAEAGARVAVVDLIPGRAEKVAGILPRADLFHDFILARVNDRERVTAGVGDHDITAVR